jgi:hypothetical protein
VHPVTGGAAGDGAQVFFRSLAEPVSGVPASAWAESATIGQWLAQECRQPAAAMREVLQGLDGSDLTRVGDCLRGEIGVQDPRETERHAGQDAQAGPHRATGLVARAEREQLQTLLEWVDALRLPQQERPDLRRLERRWDFQGQRTAVALAYHACMQAAGTPGTDEARATLDRRIQDIERAALTRVLDAAEVRFVRTWQTARAATPGKRPRLETDARRLSLRLFDLVGLTRELLAHYPPASLDAQTSMPTRPFRGHLGWEVGLSIARQRLLGVAADLEKLAQRFGEAGALVSAEQADPQLELALRLSEDACAALLQAARRYQETAMVLTPDAAGYSLLGVDLALRCGTAALGDEEDLLPPIDFAKPDVVQTGVDDNFFSTNLWLRRADNARMDAGDVVEQALLALANVPALHDLHEVATRRLGGLAALPDDREHTEYPASEPIAAFCNEVGAFGPIAVPPVGGEHPDAMRAAAVERLFADDVEARFFVHAGPQAMPLPA